MEMPTEEEMKVLSMPESKELLKDFMVKRKSENTQEITDTYCATACYLITKLHKKPEKLKECLAPLKLSQDVAVLTLRDIENTDLEKLYELYNEHKAEKTIKDEEALEAVKKDGLALAYVQNQTEEICIEAVKQDSYALAHVHNQTEKICLEAVKQNGIALQIVNNQTETICIEAVKQDKNAILYVNPNVLKSLNQ